MSAGDVATYSVPNCPWCGMLSRSKPEQHREWETVCMECGSEIYPPRATSPSAQSKACKEIAALRRQVEERRVVVPELTKDDEDAARNDWAKGSPLGTIRFGYNLAISRIRPLSPGEVAATPPPDVVTVPKEEWAALGQIVTLVNKHINDPCYLRNQLVPIVDKVRALRSGEAGTKGGSSNA